MSTRSSSLKLTSLVFASVLLTFWNAAWCAEPASGAVSQAGQSHLWTGGPFTAVSPTPGTCVESVSCDTFTLNVQIPSNKVSQIRFRIDWADATNDLDLYLLDSEGVQVDSSASSDQNFEEMTTDNLKPGTYRILTNVFLGANTSYSGMLTLNTISNPPPPPSLSTKLIFGDNTIVDFSATSGEPFIRADLQDNIFVSVPFGFSTTVSILWKSSDGGRTFIPLGSPIVRDAVPAPGGGDTHQDFDANNFLYYVDLSAACVTAAVSTDQGNTFPVDRTNSLVCVSEENPDAAGDDRQWVAAFGNGIAYVTWRNLAADSFWIFKTTNGGQSWDQGTLMGTVDQSGPLQIDKKLRRVTIDGVQKDAILTYQVFYRGTELRLFRVSDFTDGSPIRIEEFSIVNPGVPVANVFPILTVDADGNLYAVWSQSATDIYMATSKNRAQTWSKPVRVSNLAGTNIMPWAVAGDSGRVNIVWYRSPLSGNPDDDDSTWEIFMAQSVNALSNKPTFQLAKVSQNLIHKGQICLDGLDCDLSVPMRDRSFLEFPSVTIDSKGAAVVTFNDNTNQVEGSYVMVAKQINGPSLKRTVGNIKAPPGTIGPKTSDVDETGDAHFPDHGPVIGANIPALDLRSVAMTDDSNAITITMNLADLTPIALSTAAAQSGGDGLLYLVQWDYNDDIFWVAAEIRGGITVLHTGTLGLIRSATSKKFITYNPDPVDSISVQAEVINTAPGKITFRIPKNLVGNPPKDALLHSVTGYAMSQRGPLLPIPEEETPNPSSLPIKVDASGAFAYKITTQP